jgi:hypothetical protein
MSLRNPSKGTKWYEHDRNCLITQAYRRTLHSQAAPEGRGTGSSLSTLTDLFPCLSKYAINGLEPAEPSQRGKNGCWDLIWMDRPNGRKHTPCYSRDWVPSHACSME